MKNNSKKVILMTVMINQLGLSAVTAANAAPVRCEQVLTNNFFREQREKYKGPIAQSVLKLVGVEKLEKTYDRFNSIHTKDADPWNNVLKALKIKTYYSETQLKKIPQTGPLVVIGNHPFGAVDGITTMSLIKQIRPDIKVMMTDEFGKMIPEISGDIINVNLSGGKKAKEENLKQIEVLKQWLADGHAVVIFPAGEISRAKSLNSEAYDSWWKPTAIKLAREFKAAIVPIHFEGQNSEFFQGVTILSDKTTEKKWPTNMKNATSLVDKTKAAIRTGLSVLRMGTIAQNLVNKIGNSIKVNIGNPVDASIFEKFKSDQAAADFMQMLTYSLAENPTSEILVDAMMKENFPHRTQLVNPKKAKQSEIKLNYSEIAKPIDTQILEKEFKQLTTQKPESILYQEFNKDTQAPEFSVVIADYKDIPQSILELGRIREIAFRQVDEGSGLPRDNDQFDQWYKHMYIWDHANKRIAGAYRIGIVKDILKTQGINGIYTRSLFKYNEQFLHHLTDSIELGRAILAPEYQGSGAIELLFHGLYTIAKQNPQVRSYFGPVSISNAYSTLSQMLAVEYNRLHNSTDKKTVELVEAITPLTSKHPTITTEKVQSVVAQLTKWGQLDQLVEQIDGHGLPPLLRMYPTWGAKYTVFNVDPAFNSVDGLIIMDAADLNQKLVLNRYMGKEDAAKFSEIQKARRALLNGQIGH